MYFIQDLGGAGNLLPEDINILTWINQKRQISMTILAYNLYRLLAMELDRYSHFTSERIFEKFISNTGNITILDDLIEIELKKKRDLPLILQWIKQYSDSSYSWFNNKIVNFIPIATSRFLGGV